MDPKLSTSVDVAIKAGDKIAEKLFEFPKVSLFLCLLGAIGIIVSFIQLQNIFFLLVGVGASCMLFYLAWDLWYKKLNDRRYDSLSSKLDSLIHPPA